MMEPLKKFQSRMVCQTCGCDRFRMTYVGTASTEQDFTIHATMSHRGFGWNLSWFKPTCADCGSTGNPKFEVSEIVEP